MKLIEKFILTIKHTNTIDLKNFFLEGSVYFPSFRLLYINAEDQYLVLHNHNILSQFIIDNFPDIKVFLLPDIVFSKDSLIFNSKQPVWKINYIEFYRFKKLKLSYTRANEMNQYQLNTKFNTIKSFSNLLSKVTQEFKEDITITINKNIDMSKMRLIYHHDYKTNYSPLKTTIKIVFANTGMLENINKLFSLEKLYIDQDYSNLILLIKTTLANLDSHKNTCVIYSSPLLKMIIHWDIFYDDDLNFTTKRRVQFKMLILSFANIFAICIKNLEDIQKVELLDYFDITRLESELQYNLLKKM